MYVLSVLLLMVLLPIIWIGADHFYFHSALPLMALVGKWFVFWAAGIRLFFSGLRQLFQPRFTAEYIFGTTSEDALLFIRELGAANLATGVVGITSEAQPTFILPVAIAAAVFYGVAGIRHFTDSGRTRIQNVVMITDLFVSLVLVTYVGHLVLMG